jgi:hypothetical protein
MVPAAWLVFQFRASAGRYPRRSVRHWSDPDLNDRAPFGSHDPMRYSAEMGAPAKIAGKGGVVCPQRFPNERSQRFIRIDS